MIYRFKVNGREVSPNYKEDISKDYSKEPQQEFFRANLSTALKFVGKDFDFLAAHGFEQEFDIQVESSTDRGASWQEYWTGVFYKTDGEWDFDNKIVSIKTQAKDGYTELLAGLDREYNLIELAPKIESLSVDKRPLIQIYQAGASTVGCFLGGTAWEQDVSSPVWNTDAEDPESLQNKFHFTKVRDFYHATLEESPFGPAPEGSLGNYSGPDRMRLLGPPGYYLQLQPQGGAWGNWHIFLRDIATDSLILFGNVTTGPYEDYPQNNQIDNGAIIDAGPPQYAVLKNSSGGGMFSRYLVAPSAIDGHTTHKLPSDDLTPNNRNYRNVVKISSGSILLSDRVSTEPTEYGRREFDWGSTTEPEYYLPPSDGDGLYYPVSRLNWAYYSVWFRFREADRFLEQDLRSTYSLPDAFRLEEAIRVLANKIDPSRDFTVNAPDLNLIGEMMITPKSNITAGSYTVAAQRAPVTLKDIFEMLRNVFKYYWYLNGDSIELRPLKWFREQGLGVDVTSIVNPRIGKPWSFNTDKISFEKQDMPGRYEFSWADETSILFDGYPIDIESRFVKRDKVESIGVSKFSTDIDFMLLAPEKVSPDGFALFATEETGGVRRIKYLVEEGTAFKELQNGALSWYALHKNVWCVDMPSEKATVNGHLRAFLPEDIHPGKNQTITFPSKIDPDPLKLIKTNVGLGKIEKLSVSLHNRTAKADLKHDLYE